MSLYVVGIGPGKVEGMTIEAKEVLERCDIFVGYTVYTDLLRGYFPEKEYYGTPMTHEAERCRFALAKAAEGREVAVVCSGDAGIYGMAGLIYEIRAGMDEAEAVDIRVIAGVTAASSGAARLGAPLGHDFAVISLSDLLTPFETIERRLHCAAMSDMVICLYNPASKKRAEHLKIACDIILKYRTPETVCGYVRNIAREGEETRILSLGELRDVKADMFTTVYVGSSSTVEAAGNMVTPRGYRDV